MKPYNPDAKCLKCGGSQAWVHYEERKSLMHGRFERLLRKCRHCSYVWYETPLDTKPKGGGR